MRNRRPDLWPRCDLSTVASWPSWCVSLMPPALCCAFCGPSPCRALMLRLLVVACFDLGGGAWCGWPPCRSRTRVPSIPSCAALLRLLRPDRRSGPWAGSGVARPAPGVGVGVGAGRSAWSDATRRHADRGPRRRGSRLGSGLRLDRRRRLDRSATARTVGDRSTAASRRASASARRPVRWSASGSLVSTFPAQAMTVGSARARSASSAPGRRTRSPGWGRRAVVGGVCNPTNPTLSATLARMMLTRHEGEDESEALSCSHASRRASSSERIGHDQPSPPGRW